MNSNSNSNSKVIIVSVLAVALAILFSGGIYRYEAVSAGVVHKYNVFTGTVALCVQNRGCKEFKSGE